jgi:hypothetical protein
MNNEELLLLFNVFWLSFTFSIIVCVYYDDSPQNIQSTETLKMT